MEEKLLEATANALVEYLAFKRHRIKLVEDAKRVQENPGFAKTDLETIESLIKAALPGSSHASHPFIEKLRSFSGLGGLSQRTHLESRQHPLGYRSFRPRDQELWLIIGD
ncbi:MAG: hypothetical protein M0036_19140 [Desulfobacteraceae bacterium]|nr:hypothetical protein [Desulfobacteraceae bacterium]